MEKRVVLTRLCFCIVWFASLAIAPAMSAKAAETTAVKPLDIPDDPRFGYFSALLRAALDVTLEDHGPYTWEPFPNFYSNRRQAGLLENGELLNVINSGQTEALDAVATRIPIPLVRGIYGHRVLVVRKDKLGLFNGVKTLEDLKQLRAGQGMDWPETAIYRANDLPLVDAVDFENLLPLLMAGRFDYYPLSITEVQRVLDHCGAYCRPLTIEPNLMIHYRLPIYFYVSKATPDLAKRLETGLQKMIASGAFEVLWEQYHGAQWQQQTSTKRQVIELPTPDAKADPAEQDPRLWLSPLKR